MRKTFVGLWITPFDFGLRGICGSQAKEGGGMAEEFGHVLVEEKYSGLKYHKFVNRCSSSSNRSSSTPGGDGAKPVHCFSMVLLCTIKRVFNNKSGEESSSNNTNTNTNTNTNKKLSQGEKGDGVMEEFGNHSNETHVHQGCDTSNGNNNNSTRSGSINGPQNHNIEPSNLKSNLKKTVVKENQNQNQSRTEKRKVSWPDAHGKDIAQIQEFETRTKHNIRSIQIPHRGITIKNTEAYLSQIPTKQIPVLLIANSLKTIRLRKRAFRTSETVNGSSNRLRISSEKQLSTA
ncbi:hypothetical protein L484_019936 [Morus notabilis]|uniref:Uncharacterized protein n=1 Tax=Morus notabilis TaxID=981085 RepID=W9R5E5_9ROSA|nr:hypothetical protein L484_019936 [Morus notabilis]